MNTKKIFLILLMIVFVMVAFQSMGDLLNGYGWNSLDIIEKDLYLQGFHEGIGVALLSTLYAGYLDEEAVDDLLEILSTSVTYIKMRNFINNAYIYGSYDRQEAVAIIILDFYEEIKLELEE